MIYQVDRILRDVRVCMDQNMSVDSLFADGDVDSLNLDEVIRSKVVEAVERVHCMAPYRLLELGHNFNDESDAIYWFDAPFANCGWILLPEDFMRLTLFEMDDWERPVYEAISQDDPAYKKQRSRIKAIRGTRQRPVCAICMRPEGRVLEFYSSKDQSAKVSRAMYVPRPEVDDDGGVDISELCYTAVVYMVAGLTLTSCGEPDKASMFIDMAKTYLEK